MSLAKPQAIKQFEGHPNKAELRNNPAHEGKPVKPDGMNRIAGEFWDNTVELLIDTGVATAADTTALVSMAYWWSLFLRSSETVDGLQDFTSTEAARAVNTCSKAFDNYRRLAQQFGLTAQARNAITLGTGEDGDLDRFNL